MRSATIREPASFGKRREPHKIIVVRNGRERQLTVNPVLFSATVGMAFMFLFGYFAATAYLVFRDDLISSSFARQARIQHEYEDRIAALRSKLDRITSRQLLDQQAIETRVKELMARQHVIGNRGGSMRDILDEARKRGLDSAALQTAIPIPETNPSKSEARSGDLVPSPELETQEGDQAGVNGILQHQLDYTHTAQVAAPAIDLKVPLGPNDFTRDLFGDVAEAIGIIDANQRREVDTIRMAAAKRIEKIGTVLSSIGIKLNDKETGAVGGPFVPFDHSVSFDKHVNALERVLKTYDHLNGIAKALPLGTPVPGASVSSPYGSRVDPFNGRIAMHSGTDFRAKRGTPVLASGAGTVTGAGRNGGYGKVVEIRHGNGYITRYAHLSKILVKEGARVKAGQKIGTVGSTGRSTGPHLHYEVRYADNARDPAKYLKAGRKLQDLF